MPSITGSELVSALHELGQLAESAGKIIDLAVYGGSCLALVSNFRTGSEDVDAVALADQTFVNAAAAMIAEKRGWPSDWLDDGVKLISAPRSQGTRRMPYLRPIRAKQSLACVSLCQRPSICWP